MKNYYNNQPNGYLESIQKGLLAVRSYDLRVSREIGTREEKLARLKKELETADAIVIGAGAGLSTAAGSNTRRFFCMQHSFCCGLRGSND